MHLREYPLFFNSSDVSLLAVLFYDRYTVLSFLLTWSDTPRQTVMVLVQFSDCHGITFMINREKSRSRLSRKSFHGVSSLFMLPWSFVVHGINRFQVPSWDNLQFRGCMVLPLPEGFSSCQGRPETALNGQVLYGSIVEDLFYSFRRFPRALHDLRKL